ncbi:MAG: YqaE/Pmp3 family membrane protein [Ferruginibacter sp.]
MKKNVRFLFISCLAMVINVSQAAVVFPSANPTAVTEKPYVLNPVDAMKSALADFKNLSRKERKDRIKEVKHALKDMKKQKAAGEPSTNTVLLVILAILLPPLAVYLHEGVINNKFWLDLVLTLLFFIPGVIYALIVVLGKD